MRLGITLPNLDEDGNLLDVRRLADRAKMIEDAGFDGIWMPDHLPIPGEAYRDRPDPLMWLAVAATATSRVELGTCVFAVPIRTKYDVAQRFISLQALAPGRVTFGVGVGSQEREYDGAGMSWEHRFKSMRAHMAAVRATFDGELREELHTDPGGLGAPTGLPTFGQMAGNPRFVIGAWVSDKQLKRAVAEYDGWMASAGPGVRFGGGKKVLSEGIARYRDNGGGRAIVSTVVTDLTAAAKPQESDTGPFDLNCDPDTARERMAWLQSLGYDDAILWPFSFTRRGPGSTRPPKYDCTEADLALWRSLVPRDDRDYRSA